RKRSQNPSERSQRNPPPYRDFAINVTGAGSEQQMKMGADTAPNSRSTLQVAPLITVAAALSYPGHNDRSHHVSPGVPLWWPEWGASTSRWLLLRHPTHPRH